MEPLKAQMKKRNVKRAHSKKAVQKRKRKSDKCYRPSCHLQWYNNFCFDLFMGAIVIYAYSEYCSG